MLVRSELLRAEVELARVDDLLAEARGQARVAEAERGKAEAERGKAEAARAIAERERGNAVRMLGEQYLETGRAAVAGGELQRAVPYLIAAREQGLDDPGLRMLFRIAMTSAVEVAVQHGGPVTAAGFSRDGTAFVTASQDRTARLWDAASGAPRTPPLSHADEVTAAVLSPDATRLVTIAGLSAWLWDLTARPPSKIELPHRRKVNQASFSADGEAVLTASDDRTAQRWNAHTGAALGPALRHDARVLGAELSPDGARIVTTVADGNSGGIWDARTGVRIAALQQPAWQVGSKVDPALHGDLIFSAAFSPDGARVVTSAGDGTVRVWLAASGAPVTPPLAHAQVTCAVFSPDGARVASGGGDQRIRIWDVARGAPAGPALEQPAPVTSLAWSRDGTRLLAQSTDRHLRLWHVASGTLVAVIELEAGAMAAELGPDATRVVTASADRYARVWRVRSVAPRTLPGPEPIYDLAYSPDGARIVTTTVLGKLQIWSARGEPQTPLQILRDAASNVVFARAGNEFVAASRSGVVSLGDAAAGTVREPHRRSHALRERGSAIEIEEQLPARAALSPDARRYATVGSEHSARVWDVASDEPVTPPLLHGDQVATVRFSPDGNRVVTASQDGTARLWDATTGAALGAALDHPAGQWPTSAVFSPDGTRIVTVATDNHVRLWDAASHRLQADLAGHAGWVYAAVFSPDGTRLLTYSRDQSARIWDVASGTLAVPPLSHAMWVDSAAFSPDGARVVTASGPLVQVWSVRTGRPLGPPLAHPAVVRVATFSPDGQSVLTGGFRGLGGAWIWDVGVDPGSLDDWQRRARAGSFPQLREVLDRAEPASRVGQDRTAPPN
jgi:WD40 repeat protein